MKKDDGLTNYLTNIILRPHRQIYGIEKLGPSKIVVKSHEKSISVLYSMSRKKKKLPKQMNQNYCQLIEVNRRQVKIRNEGKCIQASVYEPQLTARQKTATENQQNVQKTSKKNIKSFFPQQNNQKSQQTYQNCVIFLHANSGSRIQGIASVQSLGTQYAKHVLQYRTLCVSFDYTGSGISQGEYTTMGVNESKDLSAVIQYMAGKYNVKKFSLWGRSMGAVTAVYYLLTKYKQDVKKIRVTSCILDSPFSNLEKLIVQIASKKSNIPQFVIQPFLTIIQKDIIQKIGVNIFAQLNLVEKIKKMSAKQLKLLNSVSFLGLASKDDKMISHEHCLELCELLIPRDIRSSELVDDRNLILNNQNDKHLMILVEYSKEINTKGDFIQIQGDHNKPRTNEVKEKISFFIEDNFISYNDIFALFTENLSQKKQKQSLKTMNFVKTGLSIKTKLSFAKSIHNNEIKSQKDSQTSNMPVQASQAKTQESIRGQNYNLINLSEIKAKQVAKKSLSKQKQSVRNSLSKKFLLRQRIQQNISLQNANKGLNVVSKQYNKDRIKLSQQPQTKPRSSIEVLENFNHNNKTTQAERSSIVSTQSSAIQKNKQNEKSLDYKYQHNVGLQYAHNQNRTPSNCNDSVNNSVTKNSNDKQRQVGQQDIVISSLNLSQNLTVNKGQSNLTQRLFRADKNFESLPSQRYNRNAQSQTFVYHDRIQQSPGVSTSPFDLSVDSWSSFSFDVLNSLQEQSFHKKQPSQELVGASNMSLNKYTPQIHQVKISISQFKNRKDDESRNNNSKIAVKKYVSGTRKQNCIDQANNSSTNWTINIDQQPNSQELTYSEDRLSNKNSFQFKKRQPAETNSIHNSDIGREQIINMEQNKYPNINFTAQYNRNSNQTQSNWFNKPQTVSSSFTQSNLISMKQIMISNGHKGLTQSSTFNGYTNATNAYQPPQYMYQQGQFQPQNVQYMSQCYDKPLTSNSYHSGAVSNGFGGSYVQSMKTNQDSLVQPRYAIKGYQAKVYHQTNQTQTNGFMENSNHVTQQCSQSIIVNKAGYCVTANPNQPPKKSIEYKKKITRLLD